MTSNPAVEPGANPTPRPAEIDPFTTEEIEVVSAEHGPTDRALVIFASETGLRTNEWTAIERRDVDRDGPAVMVRRRYARGRPTPYPKTQRRRVPLTVRAVEALGTLPPKIDTPLVFPAAEGGPIEINNWRRRVWHPALEAAGIRQLRAVPTAPYLRHPRTSRGGFDLQASAGDGRLRADDRPPLRRVHPRVRARGSGGARGERQT
jgi:integrase